MCFPATKTVAEAEVEFGQVWRQSHQGNGSVFPSVNAVTRTGFPGSCSNRGVDLRSGGLGFCNKDLLKAHC